MLASRDRLCLCNCPKNKDVACSAVANAHVLPLVSFFKPRSTHPSKGPIMASSAPSSVDQAAAAADSVPAAELARTRVNLLDRSTSLGGKPGSEGLWNWH